jgi:hypothetical protein
MSKANTRHDESRPSAKARDLGADPSALDHATHLIHRVCCLAGSTDLVDETRTDNGAIRSAIKRHDTAALFDWLMAMLSYQGVSDRVAKDYMEQHGRATWQEVEHALATGPCCPKLHSYWQFYGCRYHKTSGTCAEPDHIEHCPLPTHTLRNGRLNQTAYSLHLFIRDVAGNDLVRWIEDQFASAAGPADPNRISRMRDALLEPLRHVHGVSDKVLSMALSVLMFAAPREMKLWAEVGASMVAVDTLVHNFLARSGVLRRFDASHAYGSACYQANGCAEIIRAVAQQIDARQFNPRFPKVFPRFVQQAIWRYCAENGLDVCNGNRIEDDRSCNNLYCRVRAICDRVALREKPKSDEKHLFSST